MPTANTYIGPSDGWVQLADSPKFVRVSAFPHTHPYYLYAGSAAPASNAAVQASGVLTFATGVPIANETVTIGSEVWTFKASRSAAYEVAIGGTNAITAQNFKTAVNTDSVVVFAAGASNVITVKPYVAGTTGNAIATTETATNVSWGGALMTGGLDVVEGILVCHHPFKVNVTMAEKLFARVANPVPNSNKSDGKLRLDVFTIS
jgi:hypothetical protein